MPKAIKVQGKWIQSKELIQFLAHLKHLLLQNLKNKPFKYYNYGNDKLIEKSIPSTASTPPPPRREEREIPSTPKTPPPIKSNNNKK